MSLNIFSTNNKSIKQAVILLIPLLTLISGCGNNATYCFNTSIEKNITDIHVKSLKRVNIETNSNTLLYTINDISPFRSGYLIRGKEKLLYFDSCGNYLCQIGKKGRGPGEYIELSSYYASNDTVCIYSRSIHSILKYSINNNKCEYAGTTHIPDTLSITQLI